MPNYFKHHDDMYRTLGLDPKRHLPFEGLDFQYVNVRENEDKPEYFTVYVKPKDEYTKQRAGHRVVVICTCGQHVPFGRMHQHTQGSKHLASLYDNQVMFRRMTKAREEYIKERE